MGESLVLAMAKVLIFLTFLSLASGATYQEKRKVTDSSGKKFTCSYKIFYNTKTVLKAKSSVSCIPNTNGKPVEQDFVIEALGKTVTVKHSIKKGKDSISAVSLKDIPTTTASPSNSQGESMQCSCRVPGMGGSVMGRNEVPITMKKVLGTDRVVVKPTSLVRGKGHGHGGYHGGYYGGSSLASAGTGLLSSLIPLALGATLAAILALGGTALLTTLFQTTVNIIGRKLPMDDLSKLDEEQARLLSKITDRQLLSNLLGILGGGSTGNVDLASLLGGSTGGGDVVNQIAMQVVQQQVEQFISSGQAEAALTEFIESGRAEEMMNNIMQSAIENIDTEEIMTNIQTNLEESLGEMNGGLNEMMSEANMEELMSGFKLEDVMGGMNMTELLSGMEIGNMEMEMQCSCAPSPSG